MILSGTPSNAHCMRAQGLHGVCIAHHTTTNILYTIQVTAMNDICHERPHGYGNLPTHTTRFLAEGWYVTPHSIYLETYAAFAPVLVNQILTTL